MSVFKCKMCGGTIEFEPGASVGTCDSCGTVQTLPKTNDEVIANLFNRANNLRLKCEFDKAASIYEKIVQQDDSDSEAHWGLVLCKYGIEYVEDPKTFRRIPTCHRTLFEAVTADPDYLAAVDYSDISQQSIYEAEAREIDRLQRDILAIVKNEKPFDVFICYKETDAGGRRTVDSAIANDIYYQLTQEGFKVFYAAITLEDKLGQEYEPYIFAALNSAKVMLAIGTKPEYFSAVWVKNEWSRFMSLMKTDRSKLLIPCYRDMDAYDLPEEFAHLQAQDMGKIGFINDVVRGIRKVLSAKDPAPAVRETVAVAAGGANVAPLLERAFLFLEDGKWQDADIYCEKVLDQDPKNAEAYLGKLMAELQVSRREDLKNCAEPFDDRDNYTKVIRFGDAAFAKKLKGYNAVIRENKEAAERLAALNKKLTDAVSVGNVADVRSALAAGADPNCERKLDDGGRFSVLRDSIYEWPNDEIAEMLIEAGADVNYIEYYVTKEARVHTPVLNSAIAEGNVKMVRLLLEKGADPNCERKFDDGHRFSALRDSIIQWPNGEIADILTSYLKVMPHDIIGCKMKRDSISPQNVKKLKEAGVKFSLF